MPIQIRCPSCDKLFSRDGLQPGTDPRCSACAPSAPSDAWWVSATPPPILPQERHQPAPAAPASSDITRDVPAAPPARAVPPALPRPVPAPSRTPDVSRSLLPLLAAGVCLTVLVVGAGILAVLALPGARRDSATTPEVVDARPETAATPEPASPDKVTGDTPAPGRPTERPSETPVASPSPERPADSVPPESRPTTPPALAAPEEKLTAKPAEKSAPPKELVTTPEKPTPEKPVKVVLKRRRDLSEDALVRQIEKAQELTLDRTPDRADSSNMVSAAVTASRLGKPDAETTPRLLKNRADLAGLPLIMGDDCKLAPSAADHLQGGSVSLRGHLFDATGGAGPGRPGRVTTAVGGAAVADPRPDPDKLHTALSGDARKHNLWLKSEAVPALVQLLMAENESIREVLVEQLSRIPGAKASAALAQRALFDLHPRVREQALQALAARPQAQYRQALLEGFKHPWSPVADHAAEALVALKMTDAVPQLVGLLDLPDPSEPQEKRGVVVVKEMVKVNHLQNCLMCHAPSLNNEDKVRGFVPPTNQPLPPSFSREYYGPRRTGTFVKADTTYLRQDFSVPLEVKNHGLWPGTQRFDFLVRERAATVKEVNLARAKMAQKDRPPSEHQKAVFFALRELTGKDPGPTAQDWKRALLAGRELKLQQRAGVEFRMARGIAVDDAGVIYVSDPGAICKVESDGKVVEFVKESLGTTGLGVSPKGRLLAAKSRGNYVAGIDLLTRDVKNLTEGKKLHSPRSLAVDKQGGAYVTEDHVPDNVTDRGGLYYLSGTGSLTKLPVDVIRPRAVALSPSNKTLYVAGMKQEVLAYELEGAGVPGKGRVLGSLELPASATVSGCNGLAVNDAGHIFALNPALPGVQVFTPEGTRLGLARMTEVPVGCTIGVSGTEQKSLFVVTRKALFTLELPRPEAGKAVRAE